MSTAHGSFVWYELMTSDPKGAEAFYKTVLGWRSQGASGAGGIPYTLFQVGEAAPIAGMLETPAPAAAAGAPPTWFGYVGVEDIDAHAAMLVKAGGTVHKPAADIPGVGRFAMVSDPHGAVFVLFTGTGEGPPPAGGPGEPGYVGWRELMAGDVAADMDFYAALFGWTRGEAFDMGDHGPYQLFEHQDVAIGGMMKKPAEALRPHWNIYFNVDGIEAAAERVKAAGGTVLMGPHVVPTGQWILMGADPQGAMFGLLSEGK
jgi:predicted enzyme related to lactoylglutathione lyase